MLQVYYGAGKGKTTAAIGQALRMAGTGKKVHIVQLMKGCFSSELNTLKMISRITVTRCDKDYGFGPQKDPQKKKEVSDCHNKALVEGFELVRQEKVGMLILDELMVAYCYDLLDRDMVDEFILNEKHSAEIVLTGRYPVMKYLDVADYVSEINSVRHPFEKGIRAREGIER